MHNWIIYATLSVFDSYHYHDIKVTIYHDSSTIAQFYDLFVTIT